MAEQKGKILIADDEQEILNVLRLLLEGDGYQVVLAHDGQEAVERADADTDLFILDINMPKKSGFTAGAEIRTNYLAPMIFLTAYTGESDKTLGYSVGADDYITKPFSNAELLLKVKALLRRSRQYQAPPTQSQANAQRSCITLDNLTVDLERQTVLKNGEIVMLTYTEFKILELLVTHRKKIFSIENIYQSIWQDEAFVTDSAVMVHIKNLRKKLEPNTRKPQYIKTAWGKGYYIE